MDDKARAELAELQDPDAWDYEHVIPYPTTDVPRAVITVTFEGEDFIRLARHAEQSGLDVKDFIREAALEKVTLGSPR